MLAVVSELHCPRIRAGRAGKPGVVCYGVQARPERLDVPPGCSARYDRATGEWITVVSCEVGELEAILDRHYYWRCPVEWDCLCWMAEKGWKAYTCRACPVWHHVKG